MNDRQRFIVIMAIVLGVLALAAAIALGKVEEKTSYKLDMAFLILSQIIPYVAKSNMNKPKDEESEPPKEPLP